MAKKSKGALARDRALAFAGSVRGATSNIRRKLSGLTPGQSGLVYGGKSSAVRGAGSTLVRGIDAKAPFTTGRKKSSTKSDPNAVVGKYINTKKSHLKSGPGTRTTTKKDVTKKGGKSTYTGGARSTGFMDAVHKQRLHRNSPYRKK